MPPDIEQKPNIVIKRHYSIRWLRKFLLLIVSLIGLLSVLIISTLAYVAYKPINVTPLIKPWLPLSIVSGDIQYHPAGKLEFEKAIVEWPAWKEGLLAPITITVRDAKVLDFNNQVQDHLNTGKVTISLQGLLKKQITPLSIDISGLYVKLKRKIDYKIQLDLEHQKSSSHQSLFHFNFRELRQVKTQNIHIKFIDEIKQKTLELTQSDINIQPFYVDHSFAAVGHAVIGLSLDGEPIKFVAKSEGEQDLQKLQQQIQQTGKLKWSIHFDQINPADLFELDHSLNQLSKVNLPISLSANVGLQKEQGKQFFQPYFLDADIDISRGEVSLGQQILYPASGHVHIQTDISMQRDKPVMLKIPELQFQLRSPYHLDDDQSGPSFHGNGLLHLSDLFHPQKTNIQFSIASPLLDFATLKEYWPATVAKGAHAWITENMTAGVAHNFHIDVGLSSDQGFKGLELTHLGGGIDQAMGLEVHWLRPMPPLQDMNAQMKFVDANRIYIQYQGGYQAVYPHNKPTKNIHKLAVPSGDMWITGINDHHELGIIHPQIQGKLQDLLALLSEPRLNLLSKHPIAFKNPSGDVTTDLHVKVPLKKKVKIEQVGINAHNEIRNAHLGDVALGKDLKNAFLTIDVDTKHLELKGKGIFSVFPVTLNYVMQFYHKTEHSKMETAHAVLNITPQSLKQMDVDTAGDLTGESLLFLDYTKLHNGQSTIQLKFDLQQAGITLPIWNKPLGQAGSLSGDIILDKNKLIAIQNLQAQGKDLSVQADVNVVNHIPQKLNISSFQVGRSIGQASIVFPMTKEAIDHPSKGDINVSVKAKMLDFSPLLTGYFAQSKTKHQKKEKQNYQLPIAATGRYDGPRGRRWVVNLQARKIYYNQNKFLGDVTAYMEYNGVRLMRLSYGMRQPTVVTASLFPKNGNRVFHLEARDLGILLNSVGFSTQIDGGNVVFQGGFDDHKRSAPFKGKVDVGRFVIKDAPSELKTLSDASVYGLFTRENKNNIVIQALKGNLFFNNGILHISDGRVYNNEMGATLQGNVNLERALLNLEGTIIPAYAVNKLLGHIPGIGKVFSPEKGGGFLAATFGIDGTFKKPKMEVYPARLLTPGILRKLF